LCYAISATLELARRTDRRPVPGSRLAAARRRKDRFLLRILRMLLTHNVLISTRGGDGGFFLARPADQISLLDVIEAIDGRYDVVPILLTEGLPKESRRRLSEALERVNSLTRQPLEKIKMSELINRPI
jgi:Rrf2 family protein